MALPSSSPWLAWSVGAVSGVYSWRRLWWLLLLLVLCPPPPPPHPPTCKFNVAFTLLLHSYLCNTTQWLMCAKRIFIINVHSKGKIYDTGHYYHTQNILGYIALWQIIRRKLRTTIINTQLGQAGIPHTAIYIYVLNISCYICIFHERWMYAYTLSRRDCKDFVDNEMAAWSKQHHTG